LEEWRGVKVESDEWRRKVVGEMGEFFGLFIFILFFISFLF
jgi:hypothetical protein